MSGLHAPRFSEVLAALCGCLLANLACENRMLPGADNGNDTPLSAYRDSLLDIDMEYPQGWIPDVKKSYGGYGTVWNVYFEPPNTLATRRFTVKLAESDLRDTGRTLAQVKAEFLQRLLANRDLHIVDSGSVSVGGEAGFQAEYLSYLDGKPFVRFLEIICRRPEIPGPLGKPIRPGRDFSIAFEVAEETADEDMLLFGRVADRFRFYTP